jgi:hypothetical protein
MPDVGIDVVVMQMSAVLREAFEGPKERWSYFTDSGPGAGLFGTLSRLSAAEASRVLGRTPISAHVHHIVFALQASTRWIEGDRNTSNWKESWTVSIVDEEAWGKLKERLRAAYGDLQIAVARHAAGTPEAIGGALGAMAHAAYHLGAIRQKVSIAGAR